MALVESREIKNYISISADAKLRKVVPAGTPGAVERTYETKEKEADGTFKKATKIEKLYESVSGIIKDIAFVDTEYGTLLQVTVQDPFMTDDIETLSMSTSQSFAQDFMKKLPNIDLTKEVVLKPFAFTPENGKRELKGITVTQNGIKIDKSFYNTETKENTMGMPTPDNKLEKETNEMKRKEGWKRYFKDVEIFLVDYTTEHFVTKKPETMESVADDMESVGIPENF